MKCDQHVVYQSLQFRAPARPHISLVASTGTCIHRPRHAGAYGLWVMGYGLWVMGYGLWYSTLATRSELPEDPLLSSFISMSTRLAPLGLAACVMCPPDHALGTHVCQYWDPSFSSLSSVEPLLGKLRALKSTTCTLGTRARHRPTGRLRCLASFCNSPRNNVEGESFEDESLGFHGANVGFRV